jgi:hypothetical protein
MTLPPFLGFSYWFDVAPAPFLPWVDRFLVIVFGVLLVAGIVLRLIALRHGWEKLMRRMMILTAWRGVILGASGLVLYWFTYERLPVLSARFGYVLWAFLAGWWIWQTVKAIRIDLPAIEQRRAERLRAERWLPKAKI